MIFVIDPINLCSSIEKSLKSYLENVIMFFSDFQNKTLFRSCFEVIEIVLINTMAMFYTASKHIAKSSGSATLHPVPDLNSAEHFQPMCLVKRRKSFWFWKKPKMIPTQISLDSLFEKSLDLPKPKSSTLLENFMETPTLKLDGSVGAKIATELNLSLESSDIVTLTVNLGDMKKTEMDWEMIQESLQKQPIKDTHALLQEVKKSKRTTLCVVLESISTKAEGKLNENTDEYVKTDDHGNPPSKLKSIVKVDIGTKGGVEKKLAHSFTIPPDTVVAYSCNEFSINEQGYASLHTAVDRFDSTSEGLFTTTEPDLEPTKVVEREYKALTSSPQFDLIRACFKDLLETASNDMLSAMHLLFSAAEFKLESKDEENSIKISTFQKLFEGDGIQKLKIILEHIGFIVPEDWESPGAILQFPEADGHLLKSIISLLDGLQDFDVGVRALLPNISVDNMKIISNIVLNEIKSKENFLKTPQLQNMFSKEPSARLLLKNAGFVEMKVDDDDVLCFTKSKHFDLLDLYAVFYIFSF